jgi:hypothetical protein
VLEKGFLNPLRFAKGCLAGLGCHHDDPKYHVTEMLSLRLAGVTAGVTGSP